MKCRIWISELSGIAVLFSYFVFYSNSFVAILLLLQLIFEIETRGEDLFQIWQTKFRVNELIRTKGIFFYFFQAIEFDGFPR